MCICTCFDKIASHREPMRGANSLLSATTVVVGCFMCSNSTEVGSTGFLMCEAAILPPTAEGTLDISITSYGSGATMCVYPDSKRSASMCPQYLYWQGQGCRQGGI